MSFDIKSATRVDISGGTLDCWPLHLLVGDSVTINLAISISTYAQLVPRDDSSVHIHVRDLNYENTFTDLKQFLESDVEELRLIQKHAAYWKPKTGFSLKTFSESPVGGGLGGSSSLSISIIKAFSAWLKVPLDIYKMVNLAHNIEAQVLSKMTGTQDYYPAVQPGLNAIHYSPRGEELEPLDCNTDVWNNHLSLVYTGHPHHSGLNNWQVIKSALDGDKKTLQALADIRAVSLNVYSILKKNEWSHLPELFDREFEARVRLATSFSSPEIDRLREVALKSGAHAVKICGAGGGGCVLIWSKPDYKQKVEDGCREQGFKVLGVKAVK